MINRSSFALHPIPPFRLDLAAWALRRRKANIVDRWDGNCYSRIAVLKNEPVKITISQQGMSNDPTLTVSLDSATELDTQAQHDAQLLIEMILGLTINLQPFYILASTDDVLRLLVQQFAGVKPPRFLNMFEALINSIACQQVTLDVGILLLNRLSTTFGLAFDDGAAALYAFPRPDELANASFECVKQLGFSSQKSRAIIGLSQAVTTNSIDLSNLDNMTNKEAVEYLSTIRGIGRWSAEYVLLRGLGRIDTFPGDDVGAQKNLQQLFHLDDRPTYDQIKKMTDKWRPYAGLVYFHLLLDKLYTKGVIDNIWKSKMETV
jgi:DNA-3-methyladenine glycosylase II